MARTERGKSSESNSLTANHDERSFMTARGANTMCLAPGHHTRNLVVAESPVVLKDKNRSGGQEKTQYDKPPID